jgi:uroporphyrin-III C-methyltransferase
MRSPCKGKVYLVGAGPGAPDLITLRGAEVLRRADIIFHDALVHPDTLSLATKAVKVGVGKRCGRHSAAQRFINKRLVDAAHRFATVVRLKGGDPMLFGRAQEEIAALRAAGVAFEVVPGVTAALAASAQLGVSLTQRGRSRTVTFLTPRSGAGEPLNEWATSAAAADTVAVYMGAGEAATIARDLQQHGVPGSTPLVVVENASLNSCKSYRLTLQELPRVHEFGMRGPAIILMGEIFGAAAEFITRQTTRAALG